MEKWLETLKTETPQEGFELAIKLSRMGVKYIQSDMDVLKEGRKQYDSNPALLIESSHVVATHFQTVSKANNYWLKSY